MKKTLNKLAKSYFGKENGQMYFEYIVESQINGNFDDVIELFNEMRNEDKAEFLTQLTENWEDSPLPYDPTHCRECFLNIVKHITFKP